MSILCRCFVLTLFVCCLGCESTPLLPEDAVPAAFFFAYDYDRHGLTPEAGEETLSAAPSAKPDAARPSAKKTTPRPSMIKVEVDDRGIVSYAVTFVDSRPARQTGQYQLKPTAFSQFYEVVRASQLENYNDRYEGDDTTFGREVFYVRGESNRLKEIVILGTQVDALAVLRMKVLDLIPMKSIAEGRQVGGPLWVMDRRNYMIYPGKSANIGSIPAKDRVESRSIEDLLNIGGMPSEECGQLDLR